MPETQITPSEPGFLRPNPVYAPARKAEAQLSRLQFLPGDPMPQTRKIRTIRIALAGCGTVGAALLRLLYRSADSIARRHGTRFEVARVLVRDPVRERNVPFARSLFTNDLDEFLSVDCDVVVEAIGGERPALDIALNALRRGKNLVTANKLLVALAGSQLRSVANIAGGSLDFGAAVGGSAPVISGLRDALGSGAPRAISGILNGTSNLVLTLIERGSSFETALSEARCLGLAETDCSRDLDGRDSADKIAILAWEAFGIAPSDLRVRRIPLLPDPARLVARAASLGGRVRLVAECVALNDTEVTASVQPVILSQDSGLARTVFEDNRVEVNCGWNAPLCVSGPGAGGAPTATALLSDLLNAGSSARPDQAGGFLAADDPRKQRWLISAYTTAGIFRNECKLAAVAADGICGSDHDVWITTEPVQWEPVRALRETLDSHGARPVVACIDATCTGLLAK